MIGQLATRLASPSMRLARGIADLGRTEFNAMCHPTNFQKKILLWSHAYKNLMEIPESISSMQMRHAEDVLRTRANIFITVGGLFAMFGFVNYEQHQRQHSYSVPGYTPSTLSSTEPLPIGDLTDVVACW